ncbi:MAG TPA: cation-translocating P-type ATPase [Candidatus Deferrimicrobiaceae bacterium]|nr:cation-translocating P-type ATPase [Candidatus Deferrimicrobiaceae bacterium]
METDRQTTVSRIFVPAMDCPDEEKEVRSALGRLPGVEETVFHLFSRQIEVRHRCDLEEVLSALRAISMEGHPLGGALSRADIPEATKTPLLVFFAAAALLCAGAVLSLASPLSPWPERLFLAAILAGGARVALRGARELRNRSLGMNALMTISIGGATLMGEWAEAGVVVTLFALANYLEAKSLDRARRATADLFSLAPETAVVRVGGVGGEERTIAAEEVRRGDILVIRPGQRVPVDATVFKGVSDLNEAVLTGESIPVEKKEGDPLYAGTVNGRSLLLAEALRPLSESTFARILRRVEEAQAGKASIQTFMEKFAAVYTPAVLVSALLVGVVPPALDSGPVSVWAYRALVLLVIACPCAIVLAAPVVTVTALTRATREGILVKGANHLETLGKVRAVAFDKTGTLTHGRLKVTRVVAAAGRNEADVVRMAGAVEAGSAHPAAEAIRHEARRRGIAQPARGTLARTFAVLEGRGVSAEFEGRRVFVGNRRLFEEMGVPSASLKAMIPAGGERTSRTVTLVGTSEGVEGVLELEDEVRSEAPEVVRSLRSLGVEHLVMLTGDHAEVARETGRSVGIDEIFSGLLPEEKLTKVRELVASFHAVSMVGDGVNDAPALALSSVGIAMGAAGSPAAIETADVALMAGDLRRIPEAVILGRRMVSLIRQNVVASLAIKAAFLVAATAGFATLWMAVAADMGTTLLVIFNGLRLLRKNGRGG